MSSSFLKKLSLDNHKADNSAHGALPPIPACLRMVVIGDSISAENNARPTTGTSWSCHMVHRSNGRVVTLKNAAVPGQHSPAMAARFAADVLSQDPNFVVINSGTNDWLGNGNYPTETADAHIAMVNAARAYRSARTPRGCFVVICTTPPLGNVGDALGNSEIIKVSNVNRWKREYCARNSIPLIDLYGCLADKTGTFKPGYTSDGVHPSAVGYWDMGVSAFNQLDKIIPPLGIQLPMGSRDTANRFDDGLFSVLTGNRPTAVTLGSDQSNIAETTAEASPYLGNVYTVVKGAGTNMSISVGTGKTVTPGRTYLLTAQSNIGDLQFKWVGGPSNNLVAAEMGRQYAAFDANTFSAEVVAPAGVTGAYLVAIVAANTTSKLAAIGMYDLTDAI